MEYNSKSLTREGATMLALADQEEKALIIDEVIVSEKVITAGTDISTLTMADFTSPLTYGISSKVQSDNQFSVKSVITNHWQDSANTDHTTNKDFNVALVGVVAHVDGYVDQHVLTVAVGNDPFVLPAYQGTDVSFVFGITQAYSASQNVTIKMDGSAYALATDLDDVKNLQGSIGIAIDSKLKDYAKKDEVQNLIPDDIATTKNLADGDATTLKSAKEYADTQASDKVKTADTDNWQKTKITGDDGGNKYSFTTANTTDLVAAIQALPLGYHTFYCQAGVQGNPSSQAVRGIAEITTAGANPLGVGYLTDSTGAFWSFYVDSSGLKLKRSADADAIDPSVMAKTTLTANDDVFTLGAGTYHVWGIAPKNYPTSAVPWGRVVVKMFSNDISLDTKLVEVFDTSNHHLVNLHTGYPTVWSGWEVPNATTMATKSDVTTAVSAVNANMVHRNPDTGVVSEPVDFTKLTVNGGKSVATRDDLKSLATKAWGKLEFGNDCDLNGALLGGSYIIYHINEDEKYIEFFYTGKGQSVNKTFPSGGVLMDLSSIVKGISSLDFTASPSEISDNHGSSVGFAVNDGTKIIVTSNNDMIYVTLDKVISLEPFNHDQRRIYYTELA
ncbi:hypothetical protein ACRPNP_06135 [Levilactobacillus brevis]|uniref:hypothetical protein n=1 Tax=Levilactobacillus brevis TaxID=1580 RepID=UPI003D78B033